MLMIDIAGTLLKIIQWIGIKIIFASLLADLKS